MYKAMLLGVIVGALVLSGWYVNQPFDLKDKVLLSDTLVEDDEESWHLVAEYKNLIPVGEADPGAGSSGFMSIFLLDYGEVPGTVLANNATDWSASGDVHAYADTDAFSEDCPSEDPFYFVVRCRFNDTAKDAGSWNHSRFRVKLTTSGDETISGVYEYDNSSSDGDAVVSDANTNFIWINFFWDDGSDGYRITDDGSITVSLIQIEAKY